MRRTNNRTAPVEQVMRRSRLVCIYRTVLPVHLLLAATARTVVQRYGAVSSIGRETLRAGPSKTLIRRIERLTCRSESVIIYRDAAPRILRPAPQAIRPGRIELSATFPKPVMTLAREDAAAALRPTVTARTEAPYQMTAWLAHSAPASHPAAKAEFMLPARELSRVTDHVIQQLDRRTLSYRERTGRV